jgi:hypothetical protein
MAFEQKDNSGALFKNPDKKPDNNFPDYRGPCMVNGKELEISAWLKTSKDCKTKFMSLSFKPPFKKTTKVAGDDDAPW